MVTATELARAIQIRNRMPITRLASIPEGAVVFEAHLEDTKRAREHFFRAMVKYRANLFKVDSFGKVIKTIISLEPWRQTEFKKTSGCTYLRYVPPYGSSCRDPQEELSRRLPCKGAATVSLEPPNVRVFSEDNDHLLDSDGQNLSSLKELTIFIENNAKTIAETILFGEINFRS